jgi:hypothetical protein
VSAVFFSASLNFTAAPEGPLDIHADHVDEAGNAALRVTRTFFPRNQTGIDNYGTTGGSER